MRISSFCFDLIRENIDSAELAPDFRIMDETEQEVVRCILESVADEVCLFVRDGWLKGVELRAALC